MKNPFFAIVNLKIGGIDLTTDTEHFIDLTNIRVTSTLSQSLIINLFDRSAFIVEAEIVGGENNIQVSYGYSLDSMSQTYEGRIVKYNIEFAGRGVVLTLEALPTSVSETMNSVEATYHELRIDEIVSRLITESGWSVGMIVKTKPVMIDESKGDTVDNYKTYNREGENVVEFIEKKLIPDAISEDGQGDYVFIPGSIDTGFKAYFMPKGYQENATAKVEYIYIMGVEHEEIISFTPEFNDALTALIGGSAVEVVSQDAYTAEFKRVVVSSDDISDNIASEFRTVKRRALGSTYSYSQMETLAKNIWEKAQNSSYPATLVIRGNPNINPLDTISIQVITEDGIMHHSSGKYLVTQVEDTIDGGLFETTLSLVKNARANSYTDSTQPANLSPDGTSPFLYSSGRGQTQAPSGIQSSPYLTVASAYAGRTYSSTDTGGGISQMGLIERLAVDLANEGIFDLDDFKHTTDMTELAKLGVGVEYTSDWRNLQPGDLIFWRRMAESQGGPGAYKFWKQFQGGWENKIIGSSGQTLKQSGCAVTAVAINMAHSGSVKTNNFNPGVFVDWMSTHGGFSGACIYWDTAKGFASSFKMVARGNLEGTAQQKADAIKNLLNQGYYIVQGVKNEGHWVAIDYVSGSTVYMMDPGSSTANDLFATYDASGVSRYIIYNGAVRNSNVRHNSSFGITVKPANTSNQVCHVAMYLGNGWVVQSTNAYGAVHFAKLTDGDESGIYAVRRFTK